MSDLQAVHGLACPRCGGMVPVPEGQAIVQCPFCSLSSVVRGERGMLRAQVQQRIDRERAIQAMTRFLGSHMAIARDAAKQASLEEAFIAHLPFWTNRARVLGWTFGEKQVGSGDNKRYEPREVRFSEDMIWTGAACDVGEFGVQRVELRGRAVEPFTPDLLHGTGLVFEPIGSSTDARTSAEEEFTERVRKAANLDRIGQVFVRLTSWQESLVYYPLWVLRYSYRGRSFQVVVDGFSGEVLYGKAPGSVFYRAAVLVAGTALGALVAVDASSAVWASAGSSSNDDALGAIIFGFFLLAAGLGIQYAAYRAFRYGEHYEFRQKVKGAARTSLPIGGLEDSLAQVKELTKWINR
jgi:hypothetical protein